MQFTLRRISLHYEPAKSMKLYAAKIQSRNSKPFIGKRRNWSTKNEEAYIQQIQHPMRLTLYSFNALALTSFTQCLPLGLEQSPRGSMQVYPMSFLTALTESPLGCENCSSPILQSQNIQVCGFRNSFPSTWP